MQARLSDVQQRLQSYAARDYEGLKAAANLRTMRSVLWQNGWDNLFLGALTAWFGWVNVAYGVQLGYGQLVFGILLMLQSASTLVSSRVGDVRRFMILIGFAGLWNVILGLLNISQYSAILLLVLGFFQLRGAYFFYKWNQQLASIQTPSGEAVALIHEVWSALKSIKVDEEANIYEFVQFFRYRVWMPDGFVIIAPRRLRRISIARPQDFEMTYSNRHAFKKKLANVNLTIDGFRIRTVLPRLALERYEQWKAAPIG